MAQTDALKVKSSAAKPDYGTPEDIRDSIKVVFGGHIDLDPASSLLFNEVIGARKIFTREDNGLIHPWFGNVMVNPPGEDQGALVKRFWEKLIHEYACGNVRSAIWVGFNIEQLQQLQRTKVDADPMMFPICVPKKRIPFNETTKDHQVAMFEEVDRKLVPAKSPAHANFITLLPDRNRPWQAEVFRNEFSKHGRVRL